MRLCEEIVFCSLTIGLMCLARGFVPEIQMPYKMISGTSISEMNKIDSTLTCDEQRNSLQDCATECFDRSLTTTGCPGFYTDTTQSNICHLCHISTLDEVLSILYKTFSGTDMIYLLTSKAVTPNVSMNFDHYTGDTINGVNVVGTTSGVLESDHVAGIKGEGLYLHGGGKVALNGSSSECWTNLDHCTSGMTVSIWYKTTTTAQSSAVVNSGVVGEKGFLIFSDRALGGGVRFLVIKSTKRHIAQSYVALTLNEWYLLTGVYDGNEQVDFYLNGVKGNGAQQTFAGESADLDWRAHIGVADRNPYTGHKMNGYVDEFKYFFRMLNSVEIWREYIGCDLDLDLPEIIPSPDLVPNGNDYTELTDGNLATCVVMDNWPIRSTRFKVKLWNSATDKTNFTVTVVTENLECHHKGFSGLMVYGNQHSLESNIALGNDKANMHFLGYFGMMKLESKSVRNGQNECVFRHVCDNMCYYVFISVQNVRNVGPLKICEISFD